MDRNPIKKVKLENSSVPGPLNNLNELNSGKKMIASLNHDCMAKVSMYIPVLERLEMEKVCQKWKEATALSWYGVKRLDFSNLMITLDKKEKILKIIMMRCCQYLTHLKINNGNQQQYPWMCDILKNNCQNIIDFDIDVNHYQGYKIPDYNLIQIIKSMTKLKFLRVSMGLEGSSNLCNKIVDKLPGDMKEIHFMSERLSKTCHEAAPVLDKFNGLHCLTLKEFHLTNATIKSISQNKDTLVKLDLSECVFPCDALPIFSNLKNLELFMVDLLWWIRNFDANEIIPIAHNCLKLKYFEFSIRDDYLGERIPCFIFRELKYLNLEHLRFATIDTSNNNSENKISDIANNWKQLKHLNVGGGFKFSMFDIQKITEFKNLEYLHLDKAKINSQAFIHVASHCLELKKLIICFEKISELALEKLTNLKKLEILNLSECLNLTDTLLSKIVDNCKNLIDLDLSVCPNIEANSLIKISELQHFEFMHAKDCGGIPSVMVPYRIFHELKYLNLEHLSTFPTDQTSNHNGNQISDIANDWKQLKYLNAGIGRHFSLLDFQEITKFKNLEYLNLCLTNIDPQSFINITSNCLELRELSMDFKNIPVRTIENLTNLTKLEKLDFNKCHNSLTDNLLLTIANNCKNLVDLNIYECYEVREASLIQVRKLKHLKKLDISFINNVPNAMFDNLNKLEKLSCYDCPSVIDEGMMKVLDNCKKLSFLSLWGTGITVRTLDHASKRPFVFRPLYIQAGASIGKNFMQNTSTPSPYLRLNV